MTSLRLLADDLTGALDSAAEFVALSGPVHAFWHGAIPAALPGNAALDSGTRELQPGQAAAIVSGLAHHLSGVAIAFKKIDSLIRGPTIAELAAVCGRLAILRAGAGLSLPGRVTRAGRQYARRAAETGFRLAAICRRVAGSGPMRRPGRLDARLRPGLPCSTRKPTTTCAGWSRRPPLSATRCSGAAPAGWRRHWPPDAHRAGTATASAPDPRPVRFRPVRHRGPTRGLRAASGPSCRWRIRPAPTDHHRARPAPASPWRVSTCRRDIRAVAADHIARQMRTI